ncbi:hypothetical protein C2S53_019411 [Perilla frutescens var. hirtella]|uniref:F-box domain-containing protein n=1 Tax=Perilla frutescens var. hirtella TaxID=608512 RepID=A0AAD4PCJ5_PERFH|nr:hypothetical protein C2S53_019411 [Perilla frutescens var. hirtella]
MQRMVGEKRLYLKSRTRPYSFRRCKSKRVRSTNIESLPDDVLFHVLACLPADYLYDIARLVCRRWYHIIHSHAFVSTQIQRSTSYGLLLSCYSLFESGHPVFVNATQCGRIETSVLSYKCRMSILCSCEGLGLEFQLDFNCSRVPHIINPATKQVFKLPSFPSRPGIRINYYLGCGFAYAAASMEYKVVLPLTEGDRRLEKIASVAILTAGVDTSWRHIPVESLSPDGRGLLSNYPLITEGFIHWVGDMSNRVVTLDVETEVLTMSEVPLPPPQPESFSHDTRDSNYFLSTGRFLTLVVANRGLRWQFWGMEPGTGEWRKVLPDVKLKRCRFKHVGSKEEKKLFAREDDGCLEPVGWVKYPEVLALRFSEDSGGRTCIFYNLDTREINSTVLPSPCAAHRASPHKNNLMWLS